MEHQALNLVLLREIGKLHRRCGKKWIEKVSCAIDGGTTRETWNLCYQNLSDPEPEDTIALWAWKVSQHSEWRFNVLGRKKLVPANDVYCHQLDIAYWRKYHIDSSFDSPFNFPSFVKNLPETHHQVTLYLGEKK